MMNKKIFRRIVLIAVITLIFPTNAKAYWGASYDHAATVTAHVEPTGGGKVYVAVEASSFSNPGISDWKTPTSEGGNSSNTRGANLPVFIYAQANNGYDFIGWSETSSGTLFGSSDYVDSYTSGIIHGIKKNYTAHNSYGDGEEKYDIFARFNPILYDITYNHGEHGTGTTAPQNVTIKTDITLKSGSIFTPDNGYEFKEWKVTSLGSTKEKWALNRIYNSSQHIGTGYYSENVNLTAQWTPTDYTISFSANGGTGTTPSSIPYTIESAAITLPDCPYTKAGYDFAGWKPSSNVGNWTTSQTFANQASIPTGQYGDVTLVAQWQQKADITINVSGLDSNESAIFTVSNGGGVLYTVALSGSNPSVIIKDLPTDVQYTVQATNGWSWAYGTPDPTSYIFNLGTAGYTAEFTYPKNTSAKKHDEKSNVNWKK